MHSHTGLTAHEVAERVARDQTNWFRPPTSRTFLHIVRANVLTRFNFLLGALCVVVLLFRSPADALFGLVVVTNAVIGVVQETRAKRKLDALAFLHQPTSTVVRDGRVQTVRAADIVLDETVLLRPGDEVPADGVVVKSNQLEIDESNLTGESEPVTRNPGDRVLSGCFVSAGDALFRATAVGAQSHANTLTAEARVFRRTPSEIQRGIDTVLKWVGWVTVVSVPLQVVAVAREGNESLRSGVLRGVAGLVGVVPEGLVLLSTLAFFAAALSLSARNVLVQELQAVEGLARVDTVCVDKTGTLTTGVIEFRACEPLVAGADDEMSRALGSLAHDIDSNSTMRALQGAYADTGEWDVFGRIPFDPNRKWKATDFGRHGTWYLGAPEILAPHASAALSRVDELAGAGNRVLLLCRSHRQPDQQRLPDDIEPMAIVVLREQVRADALDTLHFFAEQGVRIIIVSGDNPVTVGAIAHDLGIGSDGAIDARALGNDENLISTTIEQAAVFGRVTPEQKRMMVRALQRRGHVVAMTGDGVNDSLALKSADVGIAMGNATPATKAVAQFVLLDSTFASMPVILGEGRRVIANVERVAQLFLAKNAMSFVAIVVGAVTATRFPVYPRQMTLLSVVTIGVPAFFLALSPNAGRFTHGFLRRIVSRSVPLGVAIGFCVVGADRVANDTSGTSATVAALVCFFVLLQRVAAPMTRARLVLIVSMTAVAALSVATPVSGEFLGFDPTLRILSASALCAIPAVVAVVAAFRFVR